MESITFYKITRICLAVLPAMVLACSTVNQTTSSESYYDRTIELLVNKKACIGACIVSYAKQYSINIQSASDMNYLSIESCHRKVTLEDAGDEQNWVFTPVSGIEDTLACPLTITALDKKHGKNAYGFIDFESPTFLLQANLKCNGESIKANGVGLCKSKQGLIQSISFDGPVKVYPDSEHGCPLDIPKDNQNFEFKLPSKSCVYIFMEANEPHRFFKLDALGFTDRVLEKL